MKRIRTYTTMQGIGALRIHLGLSQEAFAIELGVSRSLVSKVENRNRTLPTPALVKLAALYARMSAQGKPPGANEPAAKDAVPPHGEQPDATVFALAKKLRLEADLLEHRLRQLIAKHRNLALCLENVEWSLHAPQNKIGNKGSAYLKIHRSIIMRKMTRCNATVQAGLRKKITLLRAAAALQ